MHVAIYAPVFLRPTETFIRDAALGLQAGGARVDVLTLDQTGQSPAALSSVTELSARHRLHWSSLLAGAARRTGIGTPGHWREFGIRAALRERLQTLRPDVLLANYGQGGVLVAPVARSLEIPFVVSFHGADASRRAGKPGWAKRYRDMFSDCALATGPSAYVVNRLRTLGCPEDKARVLHYGIRTDAVPASRPTAGNGPVRFLFVGRHTPKKHPLGLVAAFRHCLDRLGAGAATLTLIGDGPLFDDLQETVKRLHLQDAVTLAGSMDHGAVLAAYEEADIYVQHSVTAPDGDEEGLPVSISEALAAGLPVIATRHAGIPEVVREGETGYLVEEHDLEGMGTRMAALASDPSLWAPLGQRGQELLRREFAVPVVQRRLRELLAEASSTIAA